MTVLNEELEVSRPLDEVFGLIGDFANAEVWIPAWRSLEPSPRDPCASGAGTR
jgi:hypothetical protein